jgi:putative acetyltransferase
MANAGESKMMVESEFTIRPTVPRDYRATEDVTREAFWNVYEPGCDEHYLLHVMRGSEGFIPELDLVGRIKRRDYRKYCL